jgi:AraC family transcriptional regulator
MRQRTLAHRGTVWLCPAGIREDFIEIAEPMEHVLHLYLPASPFRETALRDLGVDPATLELRYEAIDHDQFIEQIAERILEELEQETAAGRLLIETLALALSAHLVSKYSASGVRPKFPISADKPLLRPRLARVAEFVEAHIDKTFTVAEMASVACMSTGHFARSFRAATGVTPHAFVSGKRLDFVRQQLAANDRSIADIALAAGFSSQANFTRAFHKATGATPAQFRTKMGKSARTS